MISNTEKPKGLKSGLEQVEENLKELNEKNLYIGEIQLQIKAGCYSLENSFEPKYSENETEFIFYTDMDDLKVSFNLFTLIQQNENFEFEIGFEALFISKLRSFGIHILNEEGIYVSKIAIISSHYLGENNFSYYEGVLKSIEIKNYIKNISGKNYNFDNGRERLEIGEGYFDYELGCQGHSSYIAVQIHGIEMNGLGSEFGYAINFVDLNISQVLRLRDKKLRELFASLENNELDRMLFSLLDSITELNSASGVGSVVSRINLLKLFSPTYREYSLDSWYKDYLSVSLETILNKLTDLFLSIESSKNEIRYCAIFLKHQSEILKKLKEILFLE
ncbi:hypothetical protein LEP1GSC036_0974 [Leptospira weilii str. 2006001853]|uniref:Uncharacterized protein n=2 Tax=Leptospira weilii TaxID=28184 RepID=A0A828Z6Z5_9LEPT|nr:hypothetical protein [Leptospira weilii]EMM70814.1 hypothetical protein LEP1GSC038_2110 [Leptospira weilii str. 2006001855]EKR66197.1 hypothetical protein LEP1GSC036_0974 [Leptospira weilii str. 2006001853]EMN46824.1 hypothetical protein LEP1GSC086_1118 [Leptospira weilii str. LNT 1234]MCL8268418.1 hypothetical protein [Leptospira weilii]QDK22185.1 hypothetical protein FHG67_05150 [Leptospira weilii]